MSTLPKWTVKAFITIVLLAVIGYWQLGQPNPFLPDQATKLYPADSPTNDFSQAMDSLIAANDSLGNFNGVIGWLPEKGEPHYFIKGHQNPLTGKKTLKRSDRFHLASVSKLFTGLAALQLMADNGMDPTDAIGQYLPSLHAALGRVTVQELANHTNGIHDYLSLTKDHQGLTNQDVLHLLEPIDSTVFPPGSEWGYSNSGFVLLSLLIEAKSGVPFPQYLKKHILQPLSIPQVLLRPNMGLVLKGYYADSSNTTFLQTTGDAGMYMSAEELMAFCQNVPQLAPLMKQAKQFSSPWRDPAWRYGFGWYFSKDELGAFRAHSGQSEGFQAYLRINENQRGAFFILTNQHSKWIKPLRDGMVDYWSSAINKSEELKDRAEV